MLYGTLLFSIGIVVYLFGVVLVIPRRLFGLNELLMPINEWMSGYSGMPTFFGCGHGVVRRPWYLLRFKRQSGGLRIDPVADQHVTVALTAYDDELSIADAVQDFVAHPLGSAVCWLSATTVAMRQSNAPTRQGAVTFNELSPGYGRCVFRCLTEAARFEDTDLVVLCEGDRTFSAADIDKLPAVCRACRHRQRHAPPSNGCERTRHSLAPLCITAIFYVGQITGGKASGLYHNHDVGTTYKLIRRSVIPRPGSPPLIQRSTLSSMPFARHRNAGTVERSLECPITSSSSGG